MRGQRLEPERWLWGALAVLVVLAGLAGCPVPWPWGTPPPSDGVPVGDGAPLPGKVSIAQECAKCHAQIVEKYTAGSHKELGEECLTCHANGREHMADIANVRARVDFSVESCGTCHPSHHTSYLMDDGTKAGHFGGSVPTEKFDEFPHYKYLMGGHGFTRDYREERAHRFMLYDHINTLRRQNTACLQCKSTPAAYYWEWASRRKMLFAKTVPWSEAVQTIRNYWPETIDYGGTCSHCHDPHDGSFRLIRKGVVEAILERGTDPYSPRLNVVPESAAHLHALLNERESDGKLTDRARRLAGTLTCAQCHIEYVCGPGVDREIRDDIPWRKLADIEEYYRSKFNLQQDWRHSVTGLTGIKPQHPEVEDFWGSVHHRLQMSCADCHMPKTQDASGQTYTSHWLTSPLKHNTQTCLQCHEDVRADVLRVQDAVYAKGREIENQLNTLLRRIETAAASGSAPAAQLDQAKTLYMRALLWWEWTVVSENSMGVHYYDQAKTQLQHAQDLVVQAMGLLP